MHSPHFTVYFSVIDAYIFQTSSKFASFGRVYIYKLFYIILVAYIFKIEITPEIVMYEQSLITPSSCSHSNIIVFYMICLMSGRIIM